MDNQIDSATDLARMEERLDTANRDIVDLAITVRGVAESGTSSDNEIRKMIGRRAETDKKDKLTVYTILGPIGVAMFGFVWLAISDNSRALEKLHEKELVQAFEAGKQNALIEILMRDYRDGRK